MPGSRTLLRGFVAILLCGLSACGQQPNQSTGGANPKVIVGDGGDKAPPGLVGGEKASPQPPIPDDNVEPGVAKPGPRDLTDAPSVPTAPQSLEESLLPAQNITDASTNKDELYESKVADAFRFLTQGNEEAALAVLLEAKAAKETEFVTKEIERVQQLIARNEAAEKTVADITTVLTAGKPDDASRLATDALQQYGDTDMAEKITSLKRQADSLLSTQLEAQKGKQRFIDEANAAVKAKNLRNAVVAYEQAFANGVADPAMQKDYETLRTRLTTYDTNRTKATELRRDAYKLEDSLVALKTARDAWDTPQVQQEISEAEFALNNRRDRLAVADFEVIGDVGIPLAGRTIAEEILPYFKGRFDLVERSQLNSILGELKLDNASLTNNEVARTQVSQLSKARFLVVGSVGRLNGITINARLVDIRSGLIVQTAKLGAATPEELQRKLPALAKILQLNDEQKIAFDGEIAKVEKIEPPKNLVILAPPVAPAPNVPPPQPIIINSGVPPQVGTIVIQDFDRLVVAQPTNHVVITEAPDLVRQRAVFVSLELGDNLFRRGRYAEANRHFEFALNLAPDRREIAIRIDRCRPFIPQVVVVQPNVLPRLAVLPFVEIGDPRILRPGIGNWTADQLGSYFEPPFDVIDKGELYYWMGRLGLTLQDVIVNPQARLVLARALNIRSFMVGNLRQDLNGIQVSAKLLDPEFNVVTNAAGIRVPFIPELKLRLPELARLILLPPAPPEQVVIIQQQQVKYDSLVIEVNKNLGNKNFSLAIQFSNQALALRPNSVEVRALYIDAQRRQQQHELELARQAALAQHLERQRIERERELQLAVAAENARRQAEQQAVLQAVAQQQVLQRQRSQAQVNLVIQARNNMKVKNFSVAINFFESAVAMNRTDELTRELAQARAVAAEEARQAALQQQAAREAEVRRQREAELAAAQQKLIAEQERNRLAEQARIQAEQQRVNEEYQRLMDVAQRSQAKGNLDAQVSALQAARRLKPTPEVEKLVNAALVEQARASAEKKGDAARKELEQQLALERERRVAAESEAEKNRKLYEESLAQANTAMKARDFSKAQVQFRKASLLVRSDEALKGLQAAQDEEAKAKNLADAEAKKQAEEATKEANFQRLMKDGQTAFKTKKFDQAVSLLKAATQLKPGNVEAQTELAKAEQAKADASLEARKLKERQEGVVQAKKFIQTANSNFGLKHYDAAIVALNEALKLDPSNAEATKLMAQVKAANDATLKDAAAQAEAKKKRDEYEGLMQKGRTAMGLRNLTAALDAFQAAQKILPGDATSAQMIKDIEKQRSDLEAARLAKLKQDEQTRQMNVTIQQVRAGIRTNRFAEAEKMMADAMKSAPDNPELKKVQAELTSAKDAVALAEKKRLDEERLKSEKVKTMLGQARTLITNQKIDDADKMLAEIGTLSPTEPELPKLREQVASLRRNMTPPKKEPVPIAKIEPKKEPVTVPKVEPLPKVEPKKEPVPVPKVEPKMEPKKEPIPVPKVEPLPKVEPKKEPVPVPVPKVEPKKEPVPVPVPKVEPKKEPVPVPKVEPKMEPKKEPVPVPVPKLEPKKDPVPVPKVEPLPKVEPKKEPMPLPKIEPKKEPVPVPVPKVEPKKEPVPVPVPKVEPKKEPLPVPVPKVEPKKEPVPVPVPKVEPKMEPKKEPLPVPVPKVEPKKEPVPVPKVEPKKDIPVKSDPSAQVKQLLQAAASMEAAEKFAEAQPIYEQAVKLAPTDALLKKKFDFVKIMATGQKELATGKTAEAILSFDQAVKLFPDNASAQKLLQQAKGKGKK